MSSMGKCWRHVIINTRCTWLPGDARGFRSRKHRIHSSGDYKNPPPEVEHAGLREYARTQAEKPILIPASLREIVGKAIIEQINRENFRMLAIAVGENHLHMLVELHDDLALIRRVIGRCKQRAYYAVKSELPGRLWAAGGELKRIRDRGHQLNVFRYIESGQGQGAWVWTFRQKKKESGSSLRSAPGVGNVES